MDIFEVIKNRRSIRKYKKKRVEKEKLLKVLEAARLAPSAMNRQPYSFFITSDVDTIEKISSACNQQWETPTIIVAIAHPEKAWIREDGEEYWKADTSIAMTLLSLQAFSEGLGTCWIIAFNEKEIKKILGIENKLRIVAMTPLGYPDEKKGPVTKRKTIDELVHFEKW